MVGVFFVEFRKLMINSPGRSSVIRRHDIIITITMVVTAARVRAWALSCPKLYTSRCGGDGR